MYRQKFLKQSELIQLLEEMSDEEEEVSTKSLVQNADKVDLVILPPPRVDDVSDEENIDDDLQYLNNNIVDVPKEIAGEVEINCDYADDNENMPNRAPDDDAESMNVVQESSLIGKPGTSFVAAKKKKTAKKHVYEAKWSKSKKFKFSRQPVNNETEKIEAIFSKYGKRQHTNIHE